MPGAGRPRGTGRRHAGCLAGRIVVLREGRMVEQGTYDELAAAPGELARLLRLGFDEGITEAG